MEKIDSWDFKMVQFNAYGVADLSYELAEEFFADIPNKRTFSRKREQFKEYLDSLNAFYSKIENL